MTHEEISEPYSQTLDAALSQMKRTLDLFGLLTSLLSNLSIQRVLKDGANSEFSGAL